MKCHICDGKAEVTIEIAHEYLIRACLFHEDKIYHDLEMAIVSAVEVHVIGSLGVQYDEDKHFGIIQSVVDEVLNYIPYVDSTTAEEHRKHVEESSACTFEDDKA